NLLQLLGLSRQAGTSSSSCRFRNRTPGAAAVLVDELRLPFRFFRLFAEFFETLLFGEMDLYSPRLVARRTRGWRSAWLRLVGRRSDWPAILAGRRPVAAVADAKT